MTIGDNDQRCYRHPAATAYMPFMNDLLAVATAYREEHILGNGQFAASKAARNAYRMRHPGATDADIDLNVPRLIAEAAEEFGPWLYGRDGVDDD